MISSWMESSSVFVPFERRDSRSSLYVSIQANYKILLSYKFVHESHSTFQETYDFISLPFFSIHSTLGFSNGILIKRGICKHEIVLDIFVGVRREGRGWRVVSRLFIGLERERERERESKLRFSGALVLRRFSTATGSRTVMGGP